MDFLTQQTFTTIVLILLSLYSFTIAFITTTENTRSAIAFHMIPFLLGLAGLVAAAFNQGWIITVGG